MRFLLPYKASTSGFAVTSNNLTKSTAFKQKYHEYKDRFFHVILLLWSLSNWNYP